MREHPILFSGAMVREILAGTKTQTRRVVKPMPGLQSRWLTRELLDLVPHGEIIDGGWQMHHPKAGQTHAGVAEPHDSPLGWIRSPYGAPGDRLWVRERMRVLWVGRSVEPATLGDRVATICYEADGARADVPVPGRLKRPKVGKCLAYGGHREASRITLDVISVRVERLQDITDADIAAEGVNAASAAALLHGGRAAQPLDGSPREWWRIGWNAINGKRAPWAANPWVWCVSFKLARGDRG